jgi:hypothetical protein
VHLKKIVPYFVVGILGILLINLIASNYLALSKSASRIEIDEVVMQHIRGTLYCLLLGVLLEWRTVVKLIKREAKLSFSPLLIPGIIILLISSLSPFTFLRFGINFPFPDSTNFLSFFVGPLSQSFGIQNILAVIAGSIIGKSLSKNAPVIPE